MRANPTKEPVVKRVRKDAKNGAQIRCFVTSGASREVSRQPALCSDFLYRRPFFSWTALRRAVTVNLIFVGTPRL